MQGGDGDGVLREGGDTVKRATFLVSEGAFSCLDWFQVGILKKSGNSNDFIRFFKFICI